MNIKPLFRQTSVLIALCLFVLLSFVGLAQTIGGSSSGPAPPEGAVISRRVRGTATGFDQPPILTVGHGVFIDADGRQFTPDRDFIVKAQNYYINSLLRQPSAGQTPGRPTATEADRLISSLVTDEILANALFIDWLVAHTNPVNGATLLSINGALRFHYLLESKQTPPEHIRSKGLDRDTIDRLDRAGITVSSRTGAIRAATEAGGDRYIEECRNAGVPIPPPMFSSAWTNRGAVDNEFLSPDMRAELMHFTSTSPPGVCLALPRYANTGGGTFSDEATVLGLICLGTQTNKACFWDNPRGTFFKKGTEVDIRSFVGGADLVPNAQGVCTDCHAGENPYVVHPEKPPFAGLALSAQPAGWYDPLVVPSWPQNPGPTNLLDAVPSPGRCDSCHRVGSAGRFPDASTQLPGWCRVVLDNAVGPPPTGTMPPSGFAKGQFAAHIDALKAACRAPPSIGVVVDVDYNDDPNRISAPVVIDPLYACATKIAVRGGILDAKISVFVNGAIGNSRVARNTNFEEFDLPGLKTGDVVTATQELGGVSSASSAPVTVRDHTADFPGGLPAPEVDPGLIHECADVIAVRHVPGATLTVLTNGAFPSSRPTSTGWSGIFPGKRPFVVGDSFTAEIQLCRDRSPLSAARSAVKEPASIPAPTFNPPNVYTGQQLVTVETLVHGSHGNAEEVGTGSLGDFTTPVSWLPDFDVATPLGRPLQSGDQLRASQRLCSRGPPTETPPVLTCEQLPAPKISHPIVGNAYVVVIEAVPGARVHVYDAGGVELGDGSGTVVTLNRALTSADTITVVQQLGQCFGKVGYRVSVRNLVSQRD